MTRDPMPPPVAKASEYRAGGTWGERTIIGLVADRTQLHPGRPVATDRHRSLDYGGLWCRAREAAAGFIVDGVAVGKRVLLHLPSPVAQLERPLGLIEAGAVPVVSTESLRVSEPIEQVRAVGASRLPTPAEVTFSAMREVVVGVVRNLGGALQLYETPITTGPRSVPGVDARVTSSCRVEDPALIQIDGSCCPDVSPVVRHHEDCLCSVELSSAACALAADVVMLIGIPASYNYTMTSPGIMGALLAGAHVVFAPDPTPSTCWSPLAAHGCTHTPLVPSLLVPRPEAAGDDPAAVAGLRVIWVGGMPLGLTLAARAEAGLGVRVRGVYSIAEGLVTYSPPDVDRISVAEHRSVPMSGRDEIRIVNPFGGVDAAPDGEGRSHKELPCHGPYTVVGFLGAPEGVCGIFDADSWYHSGDIVEYQMPDVGFGRLRSAVLGNCKLQINCGVGKIFPGWVGSVLLRHPQVVEAKLIGVDDEVSGHVTRAVVAIVPDETGRYPKTLELRRFLHEAKLAAYYLPDSFEIHKCPVDGKGALEAIRRIDKEIQATLTYWTEIECTIRGGRLEVRSGSAPATVGGPGNRNIGGVMSTSSSPNYFLKERDLTMECESPTTQRSMMTKDVTMTAALGALCVAVRMVFMIAGGIAPLIWLGSHFTDAILLGSVFMLLITKVPRGGAVFLACLLTGLASLNFRWPVAVTCIVGGLMCEVIPGLGNQIFLSPPTLVITYVVFCLSFIGDFLLLWFLGDQFLGQMLPSGMSGEYVETIRSFINGPTIAVIVISIIVGALVGTFFGHRLMRGHFSVAQMAPEG